MNIKDKKHLKLGMMVRLKDKLELNGIKLGKHHILFNSEMTQCLGKTYEITKIGNIGVYLKTYGIVPSYYVWDIDWIEEIIPEPDDINIHRIYYKE